MSRYCRDVQSFQEKFGFSVPPEFVIIPPDLFDFRVKFFHEEFDEYKDSVIAEDLPTAVDSLIDLVYITCGTALYHGIAPDEFESNLSLPDRSSLFTFKAEQTGIPHFLEQSEHDIFCSHVTANIADYVRGYLADDPDYIRKALAALYLNTMFASTAMDLTNDQWDELWDDVQRANMSKERATDPSQSKRGSSYDIIKPAGWVPPRTEELVKKYLEGR